MHVKHAGCADRDAALAKIFQLIENYPMKPEDMEELQTMMAGVANIEDEFLVVPQP
jgi:tartrate dehydratase beta subunit/fumarate hydratase class I family protein